MQIEFLVKLTILTFLNLTLEQILYMYIVIYKIRKINRPNHFFKKIFSAKLSYEFLYQAFAQNQVLFS